MSDYESLAWDAQHDKYADCEECELQGLEATFPSDDVYWNGERQLCWDHLMDDKAAAADAARKADKEGA